MGRISLLIGRFDDLIVSNSPQNYYATLWILFGMIILLAIWAFFDKPKHDDLIV
jgi:hypothetical protein